MAVKLVLLRKWKEVIFILIFCVFCTENWAQGVHNKAEFKESDIYATFDEVEEKPEFPGGQGEFYKFIGRTFKVSPEAKKNKVKGKAFVQFVIEKDGSLSSFKVVKDLGFGVGDEAIRVLKLSPKWIAGAVDGKAVRVKYDLPITIN